MRIINTQKLKEIWNEKKSYIIITAVVIICAFLFFQKQSIKKVDNSQILLANEPRIENQASKSKNKEKSMKSNGIVCDISGAVKKAGVYSLKENSRLNDLIIAAGGLQVNAQVKQINRALKLKDQYHIYIPYEGEKVETVSTENQEGDASNSETDKININSANIQDLQKLNGIGQKKAEQIIEFREKNGEFKDIKDLTKISGIGDKTFEKLKDKLEI